MLYGKLLPALEKTIYNYRNWYPFDEIYLVSDSKEKSWRKSIYNKYKENRKKDSDIDWEFVYQQYKEFKESVSTKYKVLETSTIEGDAWISYITERSNLKGYCNIIVSSDYDIKQLIKFDINSNFINIMTNEVMNKTKLFLPRNYNMFLSHVKNQENDDIFNLNNNNTFIKLMTSFIEEYEVVEINSVESLLIKIISGDKSDNIDSVYVTHTEDGKKRGIGGKGAENIVEQYIKEFGYPNMNDPDLDVNIAEIIAEKKKVNNKYFDDIVDNIKLNKRLVNLQLDNYPKYALELMEKTYIL
jgi:5'-3' exonuclease